MDKKRFFCSLITSTLAGLTAISYAQGEDEKDGSSFKVNVDVVGALFGGNNSQFGESESFYGANTDDWAEGAFELGVEGETPLGQGTIFGELSGMGTRTWGDDASGLTVGVDRTYEFDWEQAHIGWRSGTTFSSLDKDALTIQAGNFDYLVGTGLLLADGASDGGELGGWYISWRKAFSESFLATLKSGDWKVEGFYLNGEGRDDRERSYGYGGDFEYSFTNIGLDLGLLYLKVPDQTRDDGSFRSKYDSLSLRGTWEATDNLNFSGEYADQSRQGSSPKGWYLQGAYKWSKTGWTPEFSYRYAHFDGDDTSTPEDESFAVAAYGFTDYGSWFQGEISGNYPLDNSNLKSHMVRLQLFPTEDIVLNAIYYDFELDQANIFGDPVGSTDWGDEINLAIDYTIGENWFVNGVLGFLDPGEAAINWTGGDNTWVYGMLYVNYTY